MDIQNLWLEKKMTVISITHNIAEAVFMSDVIFIMSNKPSSIVKTYSVDFERPRKLNLYDSKSFLEVVKEIKTTLLSIHKRD